ncbi:MAG: 16S rRNA (cytidine(1402)-2'-O)-methyltransferase [Deltaproteobacteria bacterium]|nr:16S rRNA (cytidine(1402)-2'-O)-methyltransferase [Deltaproteobacteria bacterium]
MSHGTLFVVGTPLGNLEDVTLRALRVLETVSLIAAEDTRVTKKLLERHGLRTPLASFREQNADRVIPDILARLASGADVALVSDAGTPSVSDPGLALVAAVAARGFAVRPIPGPSALAAAVSVAGLPGEGVRFLGFLARSGRRRKDRLASLAHDPSLVVLYESPGRLARTLLDLSLALGPRLAVVLREMTKIHEEAARGTLPELAARYERGTKGEVTVVVAGAACESEGDEITETRLAEIIRGEVAKGRSAKDLSADLSRSLGLPRRRIYELAVTEISSRKGTGSYENR